MTGNGGYSPYRVTIAQNLMANPAPLTDASMNVLGKANIVAPFPVSTSNGDFLAANVKTIGGAAVPGGATVAPQQYFLVGPNSPTPAADYQDPFSDAPAATLVVRTANMSYTPTWGLGGTTDERTTGLTILLRRLANPYLPYNGTPGPNYNPYVTVDYLQNVPIRSNGVSAAGVPPAPLPGYASRGKRQPYAAFTQVNGTGPTATTQATSPTADQPGPAKASGVSHTFGQQNSPLPQSNHYDWLVHLDRQVISPIELLHVSGYQPYQLTQMFMQGSDATPANMFQHYAPWLDGLPATAALNPATCPWWFDSKLPAGSTHRLSRLFEFLECGDRAFGVNGLGRIPGKININTIWDAEILQALIDANQSIGLPVVPSNSSPYATDPVAQLFNYMMQSRSPSVGYALGTGLCTGAIGPTNVPTTSVPTGYSLDRPFLPLATGASQAGQQYPNGVSIQDTLLRTITNSTATTTQLLMQNPGASTANPAISADTSATHPYLQTQLLTKLYNNVTTRSNTFAVFVTVGFFQVIPGGAVGQPNVPQLGPEIGRSEGRQVRHRMFAIVDRTNLNVFSTTYTGGAINVTATGAPTGGPQTAQQPIGPPPPAIPLTFSATGGNNLYTGVPWSIGVGSTLVFEPGTDNEETVTLQQVTSALPTVQYQATFYKSHAPGVQVIQRGNPGPWTLKSYDPRQDPLVVPYYNIID